MELLIIGGISIAGLIAFALFVRHEHHKRTAADPNVTGPLRRVPIGDIPPKTYDKSISSPGRDKRGRRVYPKPTPKYVAPPLPPKYAAPPPPPTPRERDDDGSGFVTGLALGALLSGGGSREAKSETVEGKGGESGGGGASGAWDSDSASDNTDSDSDSDSGSSSDSGSDSES